MYNKTKPRSNQQAFNRVWRYFVLDGNSQCKTSGSSSCSYRGSRGKACAVGCMMPSRMAIRADALNATDIDSVVGDIPSAKKWFSRVDICFLETLQMTHDAEGFNEDKSYKLKSVAAKYRLTIPKH